MCLIQYRVGVGTVEKDQAGGKANRNGCCKVRQFLVLEHANPYSLTLTNAEQTEAVARERRGVGVFPCTSNGVQASKQERERILKILSTAGVAGGWAFLSFGVLRLVDGLGFCCCLTWVNFRGNAPQQLSTCCMIPCCTSPFPLCRGNCTVVQFCIRLRKPACLP